MEPEAAALSQLQLQLLALVSEFRLLRERERGAREELRDAGQRWEAAAEEHRREARELRAEVAARDDSIRRLEARIKCLENENELLEKNENNLKESVEVLLQSREAFIKHYEDSTCSMQWTIQMKDKQIAVISEKLNSHLVLFSSVEKEVDAMKQVLGDVHCLVGEKENVVADLKDKVQRISVLEKDFVEKLNFLESKISAYQLELRSRARIIYELKNRLEAEKLNNGFQSDLEELKKTLLVKDEIIERLTSENQAMRLELHNMEIALQKFQDLFSSIGNEQMKNFSAISESQGVQDVNNEQLERVPGSQCGLANEHTSVTAVVKEATTQNVDHQLETDPGSMQVQSPVHFKSGALPSPELVSANTETADSLLEPKGDIDMGGLSPES
ncbi:spindle pole body component 110-like isoform X1 [Miscanthus floridulus]|uniref:spindle pole body component 110-like isoform X1 n=1 Tax=Miscanthus floridulus TaxID=154761 RepID=UPI00345AABCB